MPIKKKSRHEACVHRELITYTPYGVQRKLSKHNTSHLLRYERDGDDDDDDAAVPRSTTPTPTPTPSSRRGALRTRESLSVYTHESPKRKAKS